MNSQCQNIRTKLGPFLDGELGADDQDRVSAHTAECRGCQRELFELESLAQALAAGGAVTAPPDLWPAIEHRLNQRNHTAVQSAHHPTDRGSFFRPLNRPLAAAAILALAVTLGWLVTSAPWMPQANAVQIDFRPLLQKADGDIGAAIQDLMRVYGGEPISASQAAERLTVRIHAPEDLPDQLHLAGRFLLSMGRGHQALALQYTSPAGAQLLLLQCPPDIEKDYGDHECISCSVEGRPGHGVRVGKLLLRHTASDNVCVCVVTTLDAQALDQALGAVKIDF